MVSYRFPLNQSIDIHVENEYRIWNYHELPTGISQSLDPKSYGITWMPFHTGLENFHRATRHEMPLLLSWSDLMYIILYFARQPPAPW